jgi:hypothetical protein
MLPVLSDLDAGDLRSQADFRRLYATLLDKWLSVYREIVLNGTLQHLKILKKA